MRFIQEKEKKSVKLAKDFGEMKIGYEKIKSDLEKVARFLLQKESSEFLLENVKKSEELLKEKEQTLASKIKTEMKQT